MGGRVCRTAACCELRPTPDRRGTAPTRDPAAPQAGRGRSADTPSEIPAQGWKDILLRVYHGISEDRILLVAAGVTFYLLLSIFPGIAALFSIYGLFANPADIASHLDALANVAPGGAIDVLREEMTRLASNGGTTLGVGFLVSLAVSLWTTNSGVSAIFDALNIVYEEKEKRGLLKFYLTTLTFTLASIVFILLAIAVVVLLPVLLNFIPLPGGTDLLVSIARWPILFALTALALAALYRYGPSRTEARWRWITWGSAFATVVWIAASVLFSWYVASFGSYNKTYGSLGAIIGFMTWIWISIIVVLVGAKIDAEMEHQTAAKAPPGSQSRSECAGRGWPIRPERPKGDQTQEGLISIPARRGSSRSSIISAGGATAANRGTSSISRKPQRRPGPSRPRHPHRPRSARLRLPDRRSRDTGLLAGDSRRLGISPVAKAEFSTLWSTWRLAWLRVGSSSATRSSRRHSSKKSSRVSSSKQAIARSTSSKPSGMPCCLNSCASAPQMTPSTPALRIPVRGCRRTLLSRPFRRTAPSRSRRRKRSTGAC